jgi:dynein heavy chain 1, cytosolic
MTLGNVYDLDLKKNESKIKDVIVQAQGEVSFVVTPFYVLH